MMQNERERGRERKKGGRGCGWISEDPFYRKGKVSDLERKGVKGYKFYE